MIQAGNGFCFTLEALLAKRITRKLLWQNLDSHGAVEPRVPRAIHLSHTASAERSADLIGPKFGAWCQTHNWSGLEPREPFTGYLQASSESITGNPSVIR